MTDTIDWTRVHAHTCKDCSCDIECQGDGTDCRFDGYCLDCRTDSVDLIARPFWCYAVLTSWISGIRTLVVHAAPIVFEYEPEIPDFYQPVTELLGSVCYTFDGATRTPDDQMMSGYRIERCYRLWPECPGAEPHRCAA